MSRPRRGLEALAKEVNDLKEDIRLLRNSAVTAATGIQVPLTGHQFNPLLLATVIGHVASATVAVPGHPGESALLPPGPVTWTKITSDLGAKLDGTHIQLPHDGLWVLDVSVSGERAGAIAIDVVAMMSLLDDANFAGFGGPVQIIHTHAQLSVNGTLHCYGNRLSLGVAANGTYDLPAPHPGDVPPRFTLPTVDIKLEIHRLIEG